MNRKARLSLAELAQSLADDHEHPYVLWFGACPVSGLARESEVARGPVLDVEEEALVRAWAFTNLPRLLFPRCIITELPATEIEDGLATGARCAPVVVRHERPDDLLLPEGRHLVLELADDGVWPHRSPRSPPREPATLRWLPELIRDARVLVFGGDHLEYARTNWGSAHEIVWVNPQPPPETLDRWSRDPSCGATGSIPTDPPARACHRYRR